MSKMYALNQKAKKDLNNKSNQADQVAHYGPNIKSTNLNIYISKTRNIGAPVKINVRNKRLEKWECPTTGSASSQVLVRKFGVIEGRGGCYQHFFDYYEYFNSSSTSLTTKNTTIPTTILLLLPHPTQRGGWLSPKTAVRYRALLLHQKLPCTVALYSVAGAGRSAGGVTTGG